MAPVVGQVAGDTSRGGGSTSPSVSALAAAQLPTAPGAPSSPASPSDAWLMTVMRKESNRAMLAHLENALIYFLKDPSMRDLPFPPKGAYYRKVCCAVAQRFRLAFRVEPVDLAARATSPVPVQQPPSPSCPSLPDATPATDGPMRLVLMKTAESCIPPTRLADLMSNDAAPSDKGVQNAPIASPPTSTVNGDSRSDAKPGKLSPAVPCKSREESSCHSGSSAVDGGSGEAGKAASSTCDRIRDSRDGVAASTWQAHQDQNCGVVSEEAEPIARPATVLKRPANDGRNILGRGHAASAKNGSASSGPVKNVTEEEYETARARIFMGAGGADGGNSVDETFRQLSLGGKNPSFCAPAAERVARGPVEGSIGFARVRGKQPSGSPATVPCETRQASSVDASCAADSHDPDFDRRYSRWQLPSRAQGLPVHPFYAPQLAHAQPFQMPPSQHGVLSHLQGQSYQPLIRHPIPPPAHIGISHAAEIGRFPSIPSATVHGIQPRDGGGRYDLYGVASPPNHDFGGRPIGTEHNQSVSMLLPSHTPHPGESWNAPPIEPHVARSSGILRPGAGDSVGSDAPHRTQASYGLDSLADFPSLSAEARRDLS